MTEILSAVATQGIPSLLVENQKIKIARINSQKSEALGTIVGIVNHWTAGMFDTAFDDYHFNICLLGTKAVIVKTLNLTQKGQHVWGRNTGLVGVSLACMSNPKVKATHPHPAQIEAMAVIEAELCAWKHLNPSGTISLPDKDNTGTALVNTGKYHNFNVISDHAEFAKEDRYFPDRWDIGEYQNIVRSKVIQYHKELKEGKRKFQFKELIV